MSKYPKRRQERENKEMTEVINRNQIQNNKPKSKHLNVNDLNTSVKREIVQMDKHMTHYVLSVIIMMQF